MTVSPGWQELLTGGLKVSSCLKVYAVYVYTHIMHCLWHSIIIAVNNDIIDGRNFLVKAINAPPNKRSEYSLSNYFT